MLSFGLSLVMSSVKRVASWLAREIETTGVELYPPVVVETGGNLPMWANGLSRV
jgi:hypothetical protein